jgi:hypothetical protein
MVLILIHQDKKSKMRLIVGMLLFSMLIFADLRSAAQDVFYSKDQNFTFQNSDFSVVGWSGDRLYAYRASKEGYFLDAFNDSMKLMATIALDFFPRKIYETRFIATGQNIVVLYQAVQGNQVVQYAALLDERALLLRKPLVLDSVKMAWMAADRKYYSYAVSNDRSRIMIFRTGTKRAGRVNMETILLDNQLQVLARSNPYIEIDGEFGMGQSLLGNDGSFYFSGFGGTLRSPGDDGWLFKLTADGKVLESVELPLQNLHLSGSYLKMDDKNNALYLGGFYAQKRNGNLEGVVYGRYLPESNTLEYFKTIAFDEQIRAATDERNKRKAFNDFVVRNMVVKNDGGFILISENYVVTTRTTGYGGGVGYYSWYNNGPYGGGTAIREYRFGDIMVLSYDAGGNRIWHNFIRKEQYSQEDGGLFSSFGLLNSGSTLVFLYNDFSTSRSVLNVTAISATGDMQMKKLSQSLTLAGDWMPRSGSQTDIKELLVPVLKKNSLRFARVAF